MVNTFVSDGGIFVIMWSGERLLKIRQERGLSREALGLKTKLHPRTIENYERHASDVKRRVPDVDVLKRLSNALNTSPAYLSGDIDDPLPDAIRRSPAFTEEEIEKLGFRSRATEGDLASPDKLERMHQALLREYEAAKRLREFEQKFFENGADTKSGK